MKPFITLCPQIFPSSLCFLRLFSSTDHLRCVFLARNSYQSFAEVQPQFWNPRELPVLSAPENIDAEISERRNAIWFSCIYGEISEQKNCIWFSHFSSLGILPLVLLVLVPGGT